jgi:hypothetical protein
MTKELEAELKAAGYTEAQIAREAAYLERVARENAYFAADPSRLYVADHGQE